VKYLLDTNIYFAAIYDPAFLPRYQDYLRRIAPRTYLSSVVRYELLQGAKGDLARARISRATQQLERVGRVVSPTHDDWVRAGRIQGKLWDEQPSLRAKKLQNDILIACTARRIGAAIVTENIADFVLVRRYLAHQVLTPAQIA